MLNFGTQIGLFKQEASEAKTNEAKTNAAKIKTVKLTLGLCGVTASFSNEVSGNNNGR